MNTNMFFPKRFQPVKQRIKTSDRTASTLVKACPHTVDVFHFLDRDRACGVEDRLFIIR